ncbi:hypothetical protein [Pseudoduganella sp.]|uniref:hypothetical protein n=1 Tax=Pseudoduganella sp. TaxID=1880898 RepID=UPI0035ADEFA4
MVVLLALAGLAGCGTLHNAGNDRMAQGASKAFADAGIGKALEAERAALVKNQAERQALVKRSQLALRDASLALMVDGASVSSTWGSLESLAEQRIREIAGSAEVKLGAECGALSVARANLESSAANVQQRRSQLAIMTSAIQDAPEFSCARQPSVLPPHLAADPGLSAMVRSYDDLCAAALKATQCISGLSAGDSGLLAAKRKELAEIAQARESIATEVSNRRAQYKAALAAADKQAATPGAAAQLAADLAQALEGLEKVQAKVASVKANPVLSRLAEAGRLAALNEKKELLDGYIAALSGQGQGKGESSQAQHRVLLVAQLVNRASGKPAPPTAGILMEAELARQQAAAAQKRIERAAESERILRKQRDYLLDELGFLLDARASLAAAKPACTGKPLYVALNSGTANACSMHAAKALLSFSAAWTAGRVPTEQGDYLLLDQLELAALDESEAALLQTEAAVKAAMVQIVALHAGGIKPEDIAALAQALSLPVIAARVK